ncbi:uncharacterized protein LOC141689154 isoform X2 [Apium graveolens]|uniref:uncharacterized protein LOC141689154 isoform X2 n=1 Tax=Apium graveolens TaxID=4045 RepID=UPI003D7934FF
MDPANSPLGRMLLDEIAPVLMILTTPLVEEICQKNSLNFLQMLSPFCSFNNIDVPVRTASDQPYRLRKFKLRIVYASDVQQPDIEVARKRLKQVITSAGEEEQSDLFSDPPSIESVLNTSEPECMPTWFQYFNKELVRTVSFSDHEAFDHPVACLLVVSSRDEEPLNKFVEMYNTNQLPPMFNDGTMDPKILKHFLLLHDNQDGPAGKATKVLTEMRSTFGLHDCRLLCINSSQDGLANHQENLWAPYKSDASSSQHLGGFLSIDDLDELRNAMQDLSSNFIIPQMEQRIRVLNQQVSATRKGFRNQIKNLWWRKGKDDATDSSSGSMYTFNSIESQIRVLGDFAFMLRDYELALSNYRLLSTDYKLDKAWKQYAGVQEMMGLTYFMLDQSRKDAEYCMENAFHTYLRIGSSGMRNATRCGLWWAEMLKTRDQCKEAATVYFRISGEEPLHSAVMLEQASYCYLLADPPMLRKYGFHLILSGDLYQKCDQIKHAIRTYRGALSVFKGTKWSHIRDHVHFHIGKWYAFLDTFDVAIKNMLEILACGHQSKATQELFLTDFFNTVQKTGRTFEVLKLQLPVIDLPSLKVVFEDRRTYASPTAVSVKENLWQSLEEDMLPSLLTSVRSSWLHVQSTLLPTKAKDSNVCVSGEAISVDIGFRNPLQISLSISSISLVCEHSSGSEEGEMDAKSSTSEIYKDEDHKISVIRELNSDTTLFTANEVDVSLGGGETIMVQLKVTPKVEGALKIVGVRWKLSGSVVGFHKFQSDMLEKKTAKGRRKVRQSPLDNLSFLVIKSLPKLESFVHHLPKTVRAGDLQRLTLELRNPSEIPVKNMKMKISHPRFLSVGNPEILSMEFPTCLEKKASFAKHDKDVKSKAPGKLFLFPENTEIHCENPLLWPLWLWAATPGKFSFLMSIYYEMGDISSIIRYRTLRIQHTLEVLPSLDISFQISPCPLKLQEYLVRMSIVNQTRLESFKLHQLSAVGKEWEISLLQPIDALFPSEVLTAGQALSCFFKLKNKKSETAENEVSSPTTSEGATLRLSHGSSEALIDTRCSPLVEFHHHERVYQKAYQQERQTVDFMLISRPQRSNNNPGKPQKDSFDIAAHFACHCSTANASPVCWLMDGPRIIHHNFLSSLCEIKLKLTIYNSSDVSVSVHISTFDSIPPGSSSTSSSVLPANEAGWHDISSTNESKVTTSIAGSGSGIRRSTSPECVPPFIWSGASSTCVKLEPKSTTEVPLLICVFSPGIHDLSNYALHWNIQSSADYKAAEDGEGVFSGTCDGHPYYLTVLQHE